SGPCQGVARYCGPMSGTSQHFRCDLCHLCRTFTRDDASDVSWKLIDCGSICDDWCPDRQRIENLEVRARSPFDRGQCDSRTRQDLAEGRYVLKERYRGPLAEVPNGPTW